MVRVARIDLWEVWMPLREDFETSFGRTRLRPGIIVRVVGEGGEEGWGEVVAGEGPWYSYETYATAWHVIEDYIAGMLAGWEGEPWEFTGLVSRIRGHNMAKAGVEEALWDLKARLESRPLHSLLGGSRDRIESGVSIGIQPSLRDLLSRVSRYLDEGYRRIKVKIKPGWDYEPLSAIRKEFGYIPLQADANAAYTLRDYPSLRRLDDLNLLMLEQPLDYDDLVDHAELSRLLRTPICLDESIKSPGDAVRALKLDSAFIINIKPGRVGGIAPSLEIHDFWSLKAGRPVWIGGMLETGVGRGHLVALATLPGVSFPNDISASDRYYEEDVVEPPWSLNKDGTISVPGRPGIGVDVLVERIEKYSRKHKSLRLAE